MLYKSISPIKRCMNKGKDTIIFPIHGVLTEINRHQLYHKDKVPRCKGSVN